MGIIALVVGIALGALLIVGLFLVTCLLIVASMPVRLLVRYAEVYERQDDTIRLPDSQATNNAA
jgi:hypothetical protein